MSSESTWGRARCPTAAGVFLLVMGLLGPRAGAVSIDMVTVGNPGNAPDTRYATPGYGAVDYTFRIGKYEVTAGQYKDFLNAVAGVDTYGLYNTAMWTSADGCKISRSGAGTQADPYVYGVAPDWASRPVNYVSFGDAARFGNWLANGQPTGTLTGNPAQDTGLTEDGSYYLNGATSDLQLMAVTRKPDATWVLPSEDEWYKAAYFDPNKPGGPGYWTYPTRTNAIPSNVFDRAGTNNANYYDYGGLGLTIGPPYYRTEVGAFAGSPGPYGTSDQGGNVWEWNENRIYLRGGAFGTNGGAYLGAFGGSYFGYPAYELPGIGFRVALVPEPGSLLLLLLGGGLALGVRRKA